MAEFNIYSQINFVKMQFDSAIDNKLSDKTRDFLHTIGLPISEEFGIKFTGKAVLLPNQIVGFENIGFRNIVELSYFCLDIGQGEIIRRREGGEEGFINSSIEQFVSCIKEFENYLKNIQGKEVFGIFYDPKGSFGKRGLYVDYITNKLKEIDPVIFKKGYYWPAFIEHIENGL